MKHGKFWRCDSPLRLLLGRDNKCHSENTSHPVPAEAALILGGYKTIVEIKHH